MSASATRKMLDVEDSWDMFLKGIATQLPDRKPLGKREIIQLPFLTFKKKETAEKFYAGLNKILPVATKGYAAAIVEGPAADAPEKILVSVMICRNQTEADVVSSILAFSMK